MKWKIIMYIHKCCHFVKHLMEFTSKDLNLFCLFWRKKKLAENFPYLLTLWVPKRITRLHHQTSKFLLQTTSVPAIFPKAEKLAAQSCVRVEPILAAPRRIHHPLEKHERRIIYNIDKALQFVLSHQENMVAAIINQYGLFPSWNIYIFC